MKRPRSTMKPLHVRSQSPDTSGMSPQAVNRHPLCVFVPVTALLFMILLLVSTQEPSTRTPTSTSASGRYSSLIDKIHDTSAASATDIQVFTDEDFLDFHVAGQDGISYYHCAATASHQLSIVLLHGAAFTKEDWKRSGILQQLCSISSSLQVTALDLSVKATAADLRVVLDALQTLGLTNRLPVSALVTPSASGGAVADWISDQQSSRELLQYIETWIPVASNAVMHLDSQALQTIKALSWPILAVHGDLDTTGQRSMERLGEEAGATVKELHGTHPVYLDSPTEFVLAILDYLNVELR